MFFQTILLSLILGFVLAIGSFVAENFAEQEALINKNHKIVLTQIKKQIETQNKFINALKDCMGDE